MHPSVVENGPVQEYMAKNGTVAKFGEI